MTTSEFLGTVQEKLDKKASLYLEKFPTPKDLPDMKLMEFLYKFLSEYTLTNKTYHKRTKELHDKIVKRRTISDIYRICRFYFTGLTLEEVMVCLSHLWKQHKIGYFYCNHSEARVWMEYNFFKTHTHNPFHYAEPDEFGITVDMIKELSELKY